MAKSLRLAVIGLGYVGLPLAIEFGRKRAVVGFDIDLKRIDELKNEHDRTLECDKKLLQSATKLVFTSNSDDLRICNCYIVTVPTPIDSYKRPNLEPLILATKLVGNCLKQGDIVIYESTVYPGATEEVCIPILEATSGLTFNVDFFCGYSPERINPGDKLHRISDIKKVTSGSTKEIAEVIDHLYQEIITAGTYMAGSIKVAEAAKVIENTQRDLNIALMNELSIIFNRLEIDTDEVLKAAATKWNFLPFQPGLVGGHCIGVDPYYLTHKAQEIGYNPEIILAGRRINDNMPHYVANQFLKALILKGITPKGCKILLMGATFKENCPDLRNSKAIEIAEELVEYGISVEIYDPWIDAQKNSIDAKLFRVVKKIVSNKYDGILIAVAHDQFKLFGPKIIRSYGKNVHVLYDLKSIFQAHESDLRL